VVFQLPGLEKLFLDAENSLHVSLQGALPRVLQLYAAFQTYEEWEEDDDLAVGPGYFSLHVRDVDVAALANKLEDMSICYRSLQGSDRDLRSLLELLAMRQARMHCDDFRRCASEEEGIYQVECYFRVKSWIQKWEGLAGSDECMCRACRWGGRSNGPFEEHTYHARVRRNGRRVRTSIAFNDVDELQTALHAQGAAIKPGFHMPTN
jgi:hypothetical protein